MFPTTLKPGDIYQVEGSDAGLFFLQVGTGTDSGVFRGKFDHASWPNSTVEFRVLINQPDLKRSASRIGNFPVHADLQPLAKYIEKEIGTNRFTLITLDYSTDREATEVEANAMERMAIWEISHVVDRLNGAVFLF